MLAATQALAGGLQELRAGLAAAAEGNDQHAIRHYSEAINSGDLLPTEAALAHFNRGNAFSRSGANELALADFDAVIRPAARRCRGA